MSDRDFETAARRLAAIVESSDDAIVSKDLNGVIVTWNPAAERMFGYRADEVIGKSILILIPDGREAEEDDVLARIRQGREVAHFETIRQRKDGSLIPISLTVSPVRDGTGRIIGASKIARDISERRERAGARRGGRDGQCRSAAAAADARRGVERIARVAACRTCAAGCLQGGRRAAHGRRVCRVAARWRARHLADRMVARRVVRVRASGGCDVPWRRRRAAVGAARGRRPFYEHPCGRSRRHLREGGDPVDAGRAAQSPRRDLGDARLLLPRTARVRRRGDTDGDGAGQSRLGRDYDRGAVRHAAAKPPGFGISGRSRQSAVPFARLRRHAQGRRPSVGAVFRRLVRGRSRRWIRNAAPRGDGARRSGEDRAGRRDLPAGIRPIRTRPTAPRR